jgi:hypothetical protein
MILSYVLVSAINNKAFTDYMKDANFNQAFTSGSGGALTVVFTYILLIILLIAILKISSDMAGKAGGGMVSLGKSAQKWALGGLAAATAVPLIGGAAQRFADSKIAENMRAKGGMLNRLALSTADKVASSKFGTTTKSYAEKQEKGSLFTVGQKEVESNIKAFRDNPKQLATYMTNLSGSNRRYAYEKLSARDRAAVEDALHETHVAGGGTPIPSKLTPMATELRSRLTPEEREKTEKSAREAGSDRRNRENREFIATIPNTSIGGTPPLTPAQIADADRALNELRPNQARYLSSEARTNPEIISRLSPRHLTDLMAEGNLLPNEITAITNIIRNGVAYPKQAAQQAFINDPVRAALWT